MKKEITFPVSDALAAGREVQCFPDSHLGNVQVILAYVSRSFLRDELIQLVPVVWNFPCHLLAIEAEEWRKLVTQRLQDNFVFTPCLYLYLFEV